MMGKKAAVVKMLAGFACTIVGYNTTCVAYARQNAVIIPKVPPKNTR
jgi:predicted glycosyltransferase